MYSFKKILFYTGVSLPGTVYGNMLGSAITLFNETGCDAMLLSVTTGTHFTNHVQKI
jgi:hypothetical protein